MTAEDHMKAALWTIIIAVIFIIVLVVAALAQQRGHTHEGALGKFYQTWMRPDNRSISCCHEQDCAPAQSRLFDGRWQARNSDSEDWIDIPANKIEHDRDSPDGQSHLCKRSTMGSAFVYCFLPASGS